MSQPSSCQPPDLSVLISQAIRSGCAPPTVACQVPLMSGGAHGCQQCCCKQDDDRRMACLAYRQIAP